MTKNIQEHSEGGRQAIDQYRTDKWICISKQAAGNALLVLLSSFIISAESSSCSWSTSFGAKACETGEACEPSGSSASPPGKPDQASESSSIIDTGPQWTNGGTIHHPDGGRTEVKKDGDLTIATLIDHDGTVLSKREFSTARSVETEYLNGFVFRISTIEDSASISVISTRTDIDRDGTLDTEYRVTKTAVGKIEQSIYEFVSEGGESQWKLRASETTTDDGSGFGFESRNKCDQIMPDKICTERYLKNEMEDGWTKDLALVPNVEDRLFIMDTRLSQGGCGLFAESISKRLKNELVARRKLLKLLNKKAADKFDTLWNSSAISRDGTPIIVWCNKCSSLGDPWGAGSPFKDFAPEGRTYNITRDVRSIRRVFLDQNVVNMFETEPDMAINTIVHEIFHAAGIMGNPPHTNFYKYNARLGADYFDEVYACAGAMTCDPGPLRGYIDNSLAGGTGVDEEQCGDAFARTVNQLCMSCYLSSNPALSIDSKCGDSSPSLESKLKHEIAALCGYDVKVVLKKPCSPTIPQCEDGDDDPLNDPPAVSCAEEQFSYCNNKDQKKLGLDDKLKINNQNGTTACVPNPDSFGPKDVSSVYRCIDKCSGGDNANQCSEELRALGGLATFPVGDYVRHSHRLAPPFESSMPFKTKSIVIDDKYNGCSKLSHACQFFWFP